MNAGAMGIATFDVVETLHMITPTGARLKARRDDVAVQYRSCPILHQNIAVGATLAGQAADPAEVKIRMDQYSKKRWESQPAQPSAGCIFKNPLPSMPAGKLIDELGLKGSKVGRAMVSDVHANFIVNLGGASAKEVLELIGLVREKAYRERGLQLLMEVEIVGEELQ